MTEATDSKYLAARWRFLLALSVFFVMGALAQPEPEEPLPRYQVEVLVFQHLNAQSSGRLSSELSDYRERLNLTDEEKLALLEFVESTERSVTMDGIWRRLRASAGFRPLIYQSWIQPAMPFDDPVPVRIHDETVIEAVSTDNERLELAITQSDAEFVSDDELGPHYQIDGSISLTKGRYLHMAIDIAYRERNPGDVDHPDLDLFHYQIHALDQERQVKLDTPSYFDSSLIGVLTLVSEMPAATDSEESTPPAR